MFQNFAYCYLSYSWDGFEAESKNILDCELARLSIESSHFFDGS